MVGKDIYKSKELFARWRERYISKLRPEDRGDVERLVRELLAQGYSIQRVLKYLSCLVSISRQVKKPLRELTEEDVKEWAGWLNTTSEYKAWSRHDFQVILLYLRSTSGGLVSLRWLPGSSQRRQGTANSRRRC